VTEEFGPLDRMAGLVIGLGALDWGLVGLTNFDPVRAVFGKGAASRALYALVGASGIYAVVRGRQLTRG
jgi:uncharacterized protein